MYKIIMDTVISKSHKRKLTEIAKVLANAEGAKPKRGFKSEATRMAIDVLYELVVANQKAGEPYTPAFEQLIYPFLPGAPK